MHAESTRPRFRKVLLLMGGAVMGVFSLTVVLGMALFRGEIRQQILQRDGALLTRVAAFLHAKHGAGVLEEWDLLDVALESSGIEGIIAVRVFLPLGELIGQVPGSLHPLDLDEADRFELAAGRPVIRFFADFPLEALFSDDEAMITGQREPLVEIIAPLAIAGDATHAAIQYWLDGAAVAAEFARLDQYLLTLGLFFICGGLVIFAIVFLYARWRLLGMADLLAARNRSLEKANAELAIAAKTSAIGSVTSHLFHGLKNPLAGLKTYLRLTARDDEAFALADRMQSLVNETLAVIQQEESGLDIELSLPELATVAERRFDPATRGNERQVLIHRSGNGTIPGYKAQLLLLILRNLVENALEASSPDSAVDVSLSIAGGDLRAEVSDHGSGLPDDVRARLFQPVNSSKSGGAGIGLAICATIARHIPATLELTRTSNEGTTFRVSMPL